ncbi:hypothetical protein TNCV_2798901 [Trichonephila clavipes]|nr:hypothetical protein TNCV_2798901 [Trichonephila clavipes]
MRFSVTSDSGHQLMRIERETRYAQKIVRECDRYGQRRDGVCRNHAQWGAVGPNFLLMDEDAGVTEALSMLRMILAEVMPNEPSFSLQCKSSKLP